MPFAGAPVPTTPDPCRRSTSPVRDGSRGSDRPSLLEQSWVMAEQAGRMEEFEGGAVKGVGPYAVGLSKGRPFAVSRHCRHLRGRSRGRQGE